VPEALAGLDVLGILSASIGAGVRIKSGPNRETPGNLFILASAESGTGKSEAFRHAAKPYLDFQRERAEDWRQNELPGLKAEKGLLDSEITQLNRKNADGPAERQKIREELQSKMVELQKIESALQPPDLSVEDVTTEKLALLLSRNGECLASLSSDAGNVVNNLLGRYSKGNRTDETIYLKSYSGDSCGVHRMGREPVVLNSPCLTVLWLVQPDKVETLLSKPSLMEGGLIPRLLICHTNCQPQPIVEGVQPIPPNVVAAYGQLIKGMIQTYRLAAKPIIVTPTPDALKAMNDHYTRVVKRRQTDLRDVAIFAARWNEQAWRIAVVLHAALSLNDPSRHELDLNTAEQAIALADWFANQQLEILSAGRAAAQRAVLDKVLSLLKVKPDGITARDVQRARIANDADAARQLLERLETEGRLTATDSKPNGGGHTTRIYREPKE
jgi:hypothetical protein